MKWNESGFRPPLCTYRLNWARRTSWGWWEDWDDTVLQTQDSKFEPWRSEDEHATSRSRRLPTILTFTRWRRRNIFVSFKPPRPGTEPRTLAWKAAVLTTTLGPPPQSGWRTSTIIFIYLTFTTLEYFCINRRDQLQSIINVLHASFCFIWIPMWLVYGHYKEFTRVRRQNLTFTDVWFRRIKSILALWLLKGFIPWNWWTKLVEIICVIKSEHILLNNI